MGLPDVVHVHAGPTTPCTVRRRRSPISAHLVGRLGLWISVGALPVGAACDGDGTTSSTTGAAGTSTRASVVESATGASEGPGPGRTSGASEPDLVRLLEDPTMLGENQLPAHVPLYTYADADAAVDDVRTSPWELSLDGVWNVTIVDRPEDVPDG